MGVVAARFGDILGRGEPDLLLKARGFCKKDSGNRRYGKAPFFRGGIEMAQRKDFSVTSTHGGLYEGPEVIAHLPSAADRTEGTLVDGLH